MIELLHIDCMEYMKGVPDKFFDLAIADPPYGIDIVDEFKKTVASESSMFNMSNGIKGCGKWDKSIPDAKYFNELIRISKNQIVWGGNYFLDYFGNTRCMIVWDKMNGTNPMADAELAWSSFDKSVRIFRMHHFSFGYEEKIHPTQKPSKLYRWLLKNYAKEGDKIFDSHGGSMSIAIACHDMKFDLTLCEIDEDYYKAGVKRFEDHKKQLQLW